MLNKTPFLHQSFGPCVPMSERAFSLSLSLFQADPLEHRGWVHLPASKTLSRRLSAPSPHREGAWGLREQSKPRAGALLAFCVNQGISASFSLLYFLIGRLRTTRFQSIKGPQQVAPEQGLDTHMQIRTEWPLGLLRPVSIKTRVKQLESSITFLLYFFTYLKFRDLMKRMLIF